MAAITSIDILRRLLAPLRWDRGDQPEPGLADGREIQLSIPLSFLSLHGLAPLWSELAETRRILLSAEVKAELKALRRVAAARYLLQRRIALQVSAALTAAGIRHALFKGAAVRERLYADPALRPADDVDVLIGPDDRDQAFRVLSRAGMRVNIARANLSHEAAFDDGHVAVDLHWDIFRPGRSRLDLALPLLEAAYFQGPLPVLSNAASLFVMLVHPAFAKHVNGPAGRLIRAVDLDWMLRSHAPEWDFVLALIDAAGLRTAAWAVLYWHRVIMDTPIDSAVLRHLAPPRSQSRYLAWWIDHQLPARLSGIPGLVTGAFTLALHERPADVLRAVSRVLAAHRESGRILQQVVHICRSATQDIVQ